MRRTLPLALLTVFGCGPVDFDIVFDIDPPGFEAETGASQTTPCPTPFEGQVRASALAEVESALAQSGACGIRGDVIIDVDLRENRATALRTVVVIDGNLTISRAMTGEVFERLEQVTGQVRIEGAAQGLGKLSDVGGLSFNGTYGTALQGLGALRTVRWGLEFQSVQSLGDLLPFASLTTIGGTLRIENCRPLSTLHGLEGLRSIATGLTLDRNPQLTDVSALEGLESLGALIVRNQPKLSRVALPKVKRLSSVIVDSNPALSAVSLPTLETLAEASVVKNNTNLVAFDAPKLTSAPGGITFCANASGLEASIAALAARVGAERVKTTCR